MISVANLFKMGPNFGSFQTGILMIMLLLLFICDQRQAEESVILRSSKHNVGSYFNLAARVQTHWPANQTGPTQLTAATTVSTSAAMGSELSTTYCLNTFRWESPWWRQALVNTNYTAFMSAFRLLEHTTLVSLIPLFSGYFFSLVFFPTNREFTDVLWWPHVK